MSVPLVSVVIASLDAAEVLPGQLDALDTQVGAPPFEVLVCDNGSRDDTEGVVRRRALKPNRNSDEGPDRPLVRWVDASGHRGAGWARNVGASRARGDVLLFCDADDVVAPDWVARLSGAARVHGLAAGSLEARMLNPAWTRVARSLPQHDGLQNSPMGQHAAASNLGVRWELFEQVGGFEPALLCLEDADLCLRLQRDGHQLAFVEDAVVHVRLRTTWRGLVMQGYRYGHGYAQLTHRHPSAEVDSARDDNKHAARLRTTGRIVGPFLARPGRGQLGALSWQLAWHLGHHLSAADSGAADKCAGPTHEDERPGTT